MNTGPRSDVLALAHIYEVGLAWHCICAISRLEVPDRLADRRLTLPELAAACGIPEQPLWRVLRFLADDEIVIFDGDTVALTDLGQLLRKEHPSSMWSAFATVGPADVAHALTDTMRSGRAAAEKVFGASFWEHLAANPVEQEIFDGLMRRTADGLIQNCIPLLKWPTGGTIADIGGGLGMLLAATLQQEPALHGILVERPQVLDRAHHFISERGLSGRCELREGDLFDPAPRADVYLLSSVLHDWSDDDVVRILEAIAHNTANGGMLRIFERLIPDDDAPHTSKASDIGMLLLTGGGRERTAGELEDLLDHTGWKVEETVPAYGPISMIQARRIGVT